MSKHVNKGHEKQHWWSFCVCHERGVESFCIIFSPRDCGVRWGSPPCLCLLPAGWREPEEGEELVAEGGIGRGTAAPECCCGTPVRLDEDENKRNDTQLFWKQIFKVNQTIILKLLDEYIRLQHDRSSSVIFPHWFCLSLFFSDWTFVFCTIKTLIF